MTTFTQDLPHLAAVTFRGADAATFLNGQLTINATALQPACWQRAAYCSRQGRMLANGILVNVPAEDVPYFAFLLCADIAENTATMLKKFVLRAKVKVDTPAVHIFATATPAPALPGGTVSIDNGVVEVDEGGGRKLFFNAEECTRADMQTHLSEMLGEKHPDAAHDAQGGNNWQREEVQRGVAWVCAATQDMFIPQFVNFELLGGVDFHKGCFVGQEVIARLHHLGAVKRRGMIVRGSGAAGAGDALHTGDGKPAGEVANAAADADGTNYVAFAALSKTAAEGAVLRDGAACSVQAPPYPIIEQEKFKRR